MADQAFDALLSEVDAVLFDMDGVLLDTERLYTEATRRVLGERADEFTWEIKQKLMGRSPLQSATTLVSALKLPWSPEEYLELKRPILLELFAKAEEKPGARRLVEFLHERGIPLAVATSSDRKYFEAKTHSHPWFSRFQVVVCGSDPEVKAYKPAPDIFLRAAELIGHGPGRCLIFEDSVAGLEAARRAGAAHIIAIVDEHLDHSQIGAVSRVIHDFSELHSDSLTGMGDGVGLESSTPSQEKNVGNCAR